MTEEHVFRVSDPANRGELGPGQSSNSPLQPGGKSRDATAPLSQRLPGLVDKPGPELGSQRALSSVRKTLGTRARLAARERFKSISGQKGPTSESRVLAGLRSRGGILERARKGATRRRDLRAR
jgi:hypothetical protein